ncbi:MAG: 16S rRNA (adenine(1518)-N(6)/adenine(1519)-N(6))-dimethyltransferase RsmA [Gammaproteobacteria bacterium]|nr:16S rRNA (adenine(1518)-N(6)/adenine(1519)-N(6))-dimethyltransferase RsmA [Gammaproteobacteria bacterium]MCW8987332.1 16S rRNA (adenine(1518)-N(6)/adenine(1519)-N(6))-dimethyltransferase RsmA [Gammaproteobacteria bacterium]MCW9031990.1 16S rRNA (adenine(1518)-N(6)/adenine(1519)-N(6))-dimethyltransferase RsmA [Gammaproteobacteria bacterium]
MAHKARKRFGQNFLHDKMVIQRIVNSINPRQGDHIVEIGPGEGALTERVLDKIGAMDVVELDRDLIPLLKIRFVIQDGLTIHQADALKFDFCSLQQDEKKIRIIGNLPYNISTPLLFHLFEHNHCIEDMHFMLQKEVVERIVAKPGDSAYGRLSIMLQYFCHAEYVFTVKPGAFRPAPKVDSAIVHLVPHKKPPVEINNFDAFSKLVNHSFTMRRKTLRNILKGQLDIEQIEALGIEPTIRPERLSLEDFTRIANAISN